MARLASFKPDAFARLADALVGADHNGDGAISRVELAQAPPAMLDRGDADRDGRVTKAEHGAARPSAYVNPAETALRPLSCSSGIAREGPRANRRPGEPCTPGSAKSSLLP
ncbi:hypothetical protein [Sphingomonas sp.]|uniref:hypothetical protein n=1 Tax=Sphingomonas sp. TaxID=28214 RepID=UPI003B3BC9AC